MAEDDDMCYNRKTEASGKEEVQMRKRKAYAVLAGAALIMACTLSFTAFAKEERTPVGKIKLNFTSDIQAGEIGGNVDVTLEEGECSIESVDIINEGDNWVGGDKPKWRYGFPLTAITTLRNRERVHFHFQAILSSMYPVPPRMIGKRWSWW